MRFNRLLGLTLVVAASFLPAAQGQDSSSDSLQGILQNHEVTDVQTSDDSLTISRSASQQETIVQGIVAARWRLNVRAGPWGKIIDGFRSGRSVEIAAREGDWYRIKYGSGYAYVHTSLIKTPDGIYPDSGQSGSLSGGSQSTSSTSTSTSAGASISTKTGGINGPQIPAALMSGLEAAKNSDWFRSHKCLQFAGTVAAKGGATPGKDKASQPQSAYPADKRLRGSQINELPKAVESGLLKPGMLIHVKIHYDRDPAYHAPDDAHHWFVYMGKDSKGVPMFADNTHKGNLQTAATVYSNMKGWANSKKYGDSTYGYVPRVTAIHDPFADQR